MADLGLLSALFAQQAKPASQSDALISALLGGSTQAGSSEDALIAQLLGGGTQAQADPLASLFGGSLAGLLGGETAGMTAEQSLLQQLGLFGGGVQKTSTEDLYEKLGFLPKKADPNNVKLATYDVNALRQLGDSKLLGGNGDGKLSQQELGFAKTVVGLLGKVAGNSNPVLKSITNTANTLSRAEVFSAIAGKDGETGAAATIGAADIVLSALTDKDRDLDTIHLTVKPPAAQSNPLIDLLQLLLGKTA